ncbi:unnamed protein product (macronuclear) [Paramecium tetraurelia]|uniref:Transmembrane protein n=1 Tax=Paramecium tetraurelia TaxID=5888 RepID=A0D9T4_PARTE|nr:uncharacterized protein GSPATT00014732001 [Paramecium tetraurelia]CAK79801.1 unnamed protein product [Paramecium tetraurelia]|eukprot:XP_001447198.1 hypothetical protein (macronuclear) [Paramecium tetraurelia strain d4-2]
MRSILHFIILKKRILPYFLQPNLRIQDLSKFRINGCVSIVYLRNIIMKQIIQIFLSFHIDRNTLKQIILNIYKFTQFQFKFHDYLLREHIGYELINTHQVLVINILIKRLNHQSLDRVEYILGTFKKEISRRILVTIVNKYFQPVKLNYNNQVNINQLNDLINQQKQNTINLQDFSIFIMIKYSKCIKSFNSLIYIQFFLRDSDEFVVQLYFNNSEIFQISSLIINYYCSIHAIFWISLKFAQEIASFSLVKRSGNFLS